MGEKPTEATFSEVFPGQSDYEPSQGSEERKARLYHTGSSQKEKEDISW